jgi:hypothetical protein
LIIHSATDADTTRALAAAIGRLLDRQEEAMRLAEERRVNRLRSQYLRRYRNSEETAPLQLPLRAA